MTMDYIVLDTNIILQFPRLLGLHPPETVFLVPLAVLQEVRERARSRGDQTDRRLDLIARADEEGTVSIINTDAPRYRQLQENVADNTHLTGTDAAILAVAINQQGPGNMVRIATRDKELELAARRENIGVLGDNEIFRMLGQFPRVISGEETLQSQIRQYESKTRRRQLWQSVIGAAIGAVTTLIGSRASALFHGIAVWILLTALILSGFILFWIRERFRLIYGVFELLVGIIVLVAAFLPSHFKIESVCFTIDLGIKISGGLYIIVRGLDNITKAIKDTPLGIRMRNKYGVGT